MPDLSGQPWASETPGKMHGCGHDGHTATLLALARYLSQTRNFDGTVQLIFQPAEEGGRGALRMLADGLLDRFPFDEVYGYHNFPGLPRGVFATRPGPMMAAADIFEITMNGAGGHGAMPHLTRDVIPAAAQLVLALQTLVSRETDPMLSSVLSVTNLNAGGGAFNVIPETAKLTGTVRTFDAKLRDHLEKRIGEVAASVAATFRLTSEYTYGRITEPVINEAESTTHCKAAAAAIVGAAAVVEMPPIMGGEDFGGFLEARPGAFMGIGQGEKDPASPHSQGLHTSQYDFNDAILPLAAGYFAELAERRLPID
jgi:hippurate hydrolase